MIRPAQNRTTEELFEDDAVVEEAMEQAVRDAILFHKRMGNPIVVSDNGKIIWIPAEQIEVDPPQNK